MFDTFDCLVWMNYKSLRLELVDEFAAAQATVLFVFGNEPVRPSIDRRAVASTTMYSRHT